MNSPADTPLVTLATLLARRQVQAARVRFVIPGDWLQGRTTFGGLVSALGVQAMRDVAGSAWPASVRLLALQTNFVGPVAQGEIDAEVTVLREGKNVRQVQCVLMQSGQIVTSMVGVFGASRESALASRTPPQPPIAKTVEQIPQPPRHPMAPQFTIHFDHRWAEGGLPGSGVGHWYSRIHIRELDDDIAKVPMEIVTVMMADAFPSPALSWFKPAPPASSVSWAVELLELPSGEAADGWWRVDCEVPAAKSGYANSQAEIWAPSGALAAFSYQVLAIFG